MAEHPRSALYQALVTPGLLTILERGQQGLTDADGMLFRFADGRANVVDFIEPFTSTPADQANLLMYNSAHSVAIYRNFLDWLFKTFDVVEAEFRAQLIALLGLAEGMRVLVTGCGLGEDLPLLARAVGLAGEVHAQDISKAMVLQSAATHLAENVLFSISNANSLPYASGYFDAVFHFGGINLFGDTRQAIAELDRVCKQGGRVVFGDEGIAAHLKGTQYYEVAVCNNKLWAAETPLPLLPEGAQDIQLNYLLGNCFYVIGFTSGKALPAMNIDVPHQGTRGGTARTRYFGQLEGVSAATKAKVYAKAKALDISASELLERLLNANL